MFGSRKKAPAPVIDVTRKIKRTWWGGTRLAPTTQAEQKKMKAEIRKRNPNAVVLDGKMKKKNELAWLDRLEEFNAFMDD